MKRLWLLVIPLLLAACGEAPLPPPVLGFVDRSAGSGITFENHTGVYEEKPFLVLAKGGGVLVLDYDGDGDPDLYFPDGNSFSMDGAGRILTRRANPSAGNRLYRNDGGWRFTDVTREAGVGDPSFGVGGTVGDYDNDGDPDIYVCNWGRNVLYENRGDGTFADVTRRAGVAGDPDDYSTCAAFFDADGDGRLDLYVSNYGDVGRLTRASGGRAPGVVCDGTFVYAGPRHYRPQADRFFRNRGDGTFADATREALVRQRPAYAFQPLPFDADNDGDLDLFVPNDSVDNTLWVNDGAGRFRDRAAEAGVAFSGSMGVQAGMGADAGDFDQDGWLDLVLTDFANARNTLYRNLTGEGVLLFEDVSERVGLGRSAFDKVSWGVGLRDLDHDGFLDLFVANGHVYPPGRPGTLFQGCAYEETPNLYFGSGPPDRRLREVGAGEEPALSIARLGRGAAFADLDGDGDLDVVIACLNERPLLLENRRDGSGHWLRLSPVGVAGNRDGVGLRATVLAGGRRQLVEHRLASSFASAQEAVLDFGLGPAEVAERLVVRWPSGLVQEFSSVPADREYLLEEGGELRPRRR